MNRKTLFVGIVIAAACTFTALGDWKHYEETNLKGHISGSIKKGHVFQTQSGSIYEVTDLTLQLVLALSPKVVVLQDGARFKLIIDDFDEPLVCRQLAPPTARAPMSRTPTVLPSLDANSTLDQFVAPTQQQEMGLHKLTAAERETLRKHLADLYLRGVADGYLLNDGTSGEQQAAVGTTPAVIESRIDGQFEGWKGDTVIKLVNGQVWQQAEHHYHYHYAHRPEVLIYPTDGVYKMKVDGVDEAVSVKRLK